MEITNTLKTEKNQQTGSTFFVIGEADDVQASIRFWREGHTPERTMIAFRLRVTPKIEALNFAHYLNAKWPTINWTGHGSGHVSIAGGTGYAAHPKNVEAILGLAEENDIAGKLFGLIETSFPGLELKLDKYQFAAFYREQVMAALEVVVPDTPVGKSVVLEFAKYKQQFENGKEVDSSASDAPNCGL